jgi:hypothetical protein
MTLALPLMDLMYTGCFYQSAFLWVRLSWLSVYLDTFAVTNADITVRRVYLAIGVVVVVTVDIITVAGCRDILAAEIIHLVIQFTLLILLVLLHHSTYFLFLL